MTIGELAAHARVTRDAIRFYERAGLLDTPKRGENRHRVYGPKAAEQVALIRRLQNCGLTIEDIRQVLVLARKDGPESTRALVEIMQARLAFINERLAQLKSCREGLKEAIRLCSGARLNAGTALSRLPDSGLSPPFRFGRRGAV
jgi:DNA-binding transcriptional MerR regulator